MKMEHLIEEIVLKNQYQVPQKQKEKILLPILKKQLEYNRINPNINSMYNKLDIDISKIQSLEQIPFIPVNMFKKFDLLTCNKKDIIRILNSSSTTTGIPSKIYLDRYTAMHQSQALLTTLKSFLGGTRRPLLVLDTEAVNKSGNILSARGAAIRGISNFASSITYAMDGENDNLEVNFERLKKFEQDNREKEILVYGFTYIIWSKFLKIMERKNIKMDLSNMKLMHSGGWKKLASEKVGKDEFNRRTASIFSSKRENIMDFYGMAEQLGVVFVDCEYGYKHVPDFADVIIRDFNSLQEAEIGQRGVIEVVSILGSSYPSQAVLTEDIGQLLGIDDCKCGRKGRYFKFKSRMQRSETRGCGDTFAEREKNR